MFLREARRHDVGGIPWQWRLHRSVHLRDEDVEPSISSSVMVGGKSNFQPSAMAAYQSWKTQAMKSSMSSFASSFW
jgi:hypothetical protein